MSETYDPFTDPPPATGAELEEAKGALTIAIRELPQADTVGQMPWGDGLTDAEFVATAAAWLNSYAARVGQIQTTAASMSAELIELRNQRAAVRSFFGITELSGDS
jgi:hypothetical protein